MLNFGVEELPEDSYQDASFENLSSHNTEDTIEYRWAFSAGLLSILIWSQAAQAGCV
jgi:hypothetical protein